MLISALAISIHVCPFLRFIKEIIKKEKRNLYCDHNMVEDYSRGSVSLS